MPVQPVARGFFGKIPSRGDFVQKGLPRDFVQAWDGWLAAAFGAGREVLGQRWDEAFMTAPLWRFHLFPGVCSAQAVAGVMSPSVDRVGRAYPLVLCQVGGVSAGQVLSAAAASWYRSLEGLAVAALEQRLEPDHIENGLAGLETASDPTGTDGARSLRYPLRTTDDPLTGMPAEVLVALAGSGPAGLSLWWTEGSDLVEPSFLLCRGLPSPAEFPALLSGEWGAHGWGPCSKWREDGAPG